MFPAAQAELGVLEGKNRREQEKTPVGKWPSAKAWLEGD